MESTGNFHDIINHIMDGPWRLAVELGNTFVLTTGTIMMIMFPKH